MMREREKKRYMQAGKPAELVSKNSEKMSTAAAAATLVEESVDSFGWLMEGYIYIWPLSLSAK